MTEKEAYRSLLAQKKELMFKFLRLSNDVTLTDPSPEQNAESYIRLVEAREEVIDDLRRLDGELDQFGEPPGMSDESALLNQEMKEMADQMARLETDIRSKASGVMSRLQREIKVINDRRKESDGEYTPGMLYHRNA